MCVAVTSAGVVPRRAENSLYDTYKRGKTETIEAKLTKNWGRREEKKSKMEG